MSTIFYVRHGQTDQNKNNILTGRTNVSINEIGVAQAEKTANTLKNEKIDILFCSPLLRAKQTANIINKYHNLPIIEDVRIIERDYGDYTGKNTADIDRKTSWNYFHCDAVYPNVESPKAILTRVQSFIDMLKLEYKDKKILVVAHSGVGRLFNVYFNGMPENGDLLKTSMNNAEVAKFEF